MTISNASNRITYNGNGATVLFNFTFKVFASTDVVVYTNDGTTETELTAGVNYTISINGDQNGSPGGSITINPALPSGTSVTIIRDISSTQEVDLVNGGAFYAESIENALDKLTMIAQQAQERADRALAVAITSTDDPDVLLEELMTIGDTAASSAAAAAASASAASTSATLAAQSFVDTSASTVAVGTGSKTWTVSTGKNFRSGQFVTISDSADTANYCYGTVTSYNSGTGSLVVNVTTIGGSGTKSSWNVSLSGAKGAQGDTGPQGAAGDRGITWRGAWNSGTTYAENDAVSYSVTGSSYVSKSAGNLNNVPTDTGFWDVLANKGADGLGSGTVTTVSVATANGLAGSVATATSTPTITLSTSITGMLKGNGTAISAATPGTDYSTASSSETLTNKTISSSNNTVSGFGLTGKQTIWIPAGAMTARTTNGAAAGTAETATNKIMIKTLDFDASTAEYAQFQIRMPKSWDESTVTAYFLWSNASGTGNVVWGIQGVALSDDDVLDAAFGTAQTVTDGVTAAGDLMQSAETSAMTVGGTPVTNDLVVFQVYRDAASGSDTLAVDARLHGVVIVYSIDAGNDA